ncbi:MAG: class D beta-lactamase [Methylophaga sp.]|nr:MAG: class D beta-lactamase [Methylophaga sp.]
MLKTTFTNILLLSLVPSYLFANEGDIADLYTSAGIEGVLLIQSINGEVEYTHNPAKLTQTYIPASTFKIPNTLIALEEGVIKDQFELINWDGIEREYSPWNQDQTLATAFSRSCVWCYQRFSEQIEKKTYNKYLHDFNYGNQKTGGNTSTFWLDGDLKISVQDQVSFLRKVYLEQLPIKHKNFSILKEIMLSENTPNYKIWAKTGWKGQHGWYVGYIEAENNVWFFANHIAIKAPSDLILRRQLTIEALKLKGII